MTPEEVAGRNFLRPAELAELFNTDPRTIRKDCATGQIRATCVGGRWLIPTAWVLEQLSGGTSAAPSLNEAELADRVAARVTEKLAAAFAALNDAGGRQE